MEYHLGRIEELDLPAARPEERIKEIGGEFVETLRKFLIVYPALRVQVFGKDRVASTGIFILRCAGMEKFSF